MKLERLDWLEKRRSGLGGSDISAIMGHNPWSSPFDVWLSKTEPPAEDRVETTSQMRGRILEPSIADWYSEVTGYTVTDPGAFEIAQHPIHSFMLATVDRMVVDPSTGEKFGLEIKTARDAKGWGPEDWQDIPMVYMCQVQWYMLVKGLKRWDLAVFFLLQDQFRRYTITAQDWFQDAMTETAGNWWEIHVVGGKQPELSGTKGTDDWLMSRYPDGEGLRDATDDEVALMEKILFLKKSEKALSAERAIIENELKSRIGDSERIEFGKLKATWKSQTSSRMDTRRLAKEQPDIASEYRKESTTRILRVDDRR